MNKKLEDLKKEYESIMPPEGYRKRIEDILQNNRGNETMKQKKYQLPIAVAASFIILVTGALNISPTFAETLSQVPGLSGIIRVLTLNRYEAQKNGMEANVVTPKVEGLLNKELEEKLNKEFAENAKEIIATFEAELKKMQEAYPEETLHKGVNAGFAVKTDTEAYFAIDLYLEQIEASSYVTHKFYTIDKKTSQLVTLKELFQKDAGYIGVISAYIKEEMRRQNEAGEATYFIDSDIPEDNFVQIKEEQNFYINEKGELVICFNEYEVGPGAMGSPEFVIPNAVIADILA